MFEAGTSVLQKSGEIEEKLNLSIDSDQTHSSSPVSNMIALLLSVIMIVIMIW